MRKSSFISGLKLLSTKRGALVASLLFILTSCSLFGSLNARKLLANCKYDLESIEVEVAKFRSAIFIGEGKEKTKVKVSDGMGIIQEHWEDIKEGRFNLDFRKIKLLANLKIENPNDQYVVIDSLILDAFMDTGDAFTRIIHDHSLEIPAKTTGRTQFKVEIPIEMGLLKLMDQEKIKFKGTVWAKMKIADELQATIPLPVEFEQKVPRKKLTKMIEKQKKVALKEFYKKIEKATGVKAKDVNNIQEKASKVIQDLF